MPTLRKRDGCWQCVARIKPDGVLSIPEVCQVSGHLSWETLRRYTHLKPQDVLDKMNARP